MKIVGQNKTMVLTAERAKYLMTHQANQRAPIERHVNGLAKLLSRVGWRNDQRICITEDMRIINGLQRLSAIVKLGDYGWSIPVTVFKNEEMTNDLLSSFNVQKQDGSRRLMRRLYGWTDCRMTSICNLLWKLFDEKQNATTTDLACVYEAVKQHIDIVLSVKEEKKAGASSVPTLMQVAAVLCSLDGMDMSKFIEAANEFVADNRSCVIWKELKEWGMKWRSMFEKNGEKNLASEIGGAPVRVAKRCMLLSAFLQGKKIVKIANMKESDVMATVDHYRAILKNII